MNLEEYRTIKNYEGLYEVSNFGNVRNSKTNIILKLKTDKGGYVRVQLSKDGKGKDSLVHRLVAIAFISNDENKPTVDHIIRNPQNNNVSNLRWATYSEQMSNKGYYHHPKTENHHIYITSVMTYGVSFMINKKRTQKTFKTLELAINFRDKYMLDNPR